MSYVQKSVEITPENFTSKQREIVGAECRARQRTCVGVTVTFYEHERKPSFQINGWHVTLIVSSFNFTFTLNILHPVIDVCVQTFNVVKYERIK